MKEGMTKILVADDDVVVRAAVAKILEMSGYLVDTAINGEEVLDIVNETYDVIILDIHMPGMNGFETISELNRLALEIPVLFLTGSGSMDYAVKAINSGAYDFLTKPIDDLDIFNVKIRRAIEKRNYVLREREYKAALEDDVQVKAQQLLEHRFLQLDYSSKVQHPDALAKQLLRCQGIPEKILRLATELSSGNLGNNNPTYNDNVL